MASQKKPIIVTVSDDGMKNIKKIAANLTAKGMSIKRVMPMTGTITGSSKSKKSLEALRKVKGVASVEEDQVAELPPPDSKLQ